MVIFAIKFPKNRARLYILGVIEIIEFRKEIITNLLTVKKIPP